MYFEPGSMEKMVTEMFKILGMIGNMVKEDDEENIEALEDQHIISVTDENGEQYVYEKDPDLPDDVEVFNMK